MFHAPLISSHLNKMGGLKTFNTCEKTFRSNPFKSNKNNLYNIYRLSPYTLMGNSSESLMNYTFTKSIILRALI